MATGQLAPQPAAVTDVDRMPVHGIDHLEAYVMPAEPAAFFTRASFHRDGLQRPPRLAVATASPTCSSRDGSLVVTGTLAGDDEIGEHHKRHGDGVHKVALSVPDAEAATGRPSSTGRAG